MHVWEGTATKTLDCGTEAWSSGTECRTGSWDQGPRIPPSECRPGPPGPGEPMAAGTCCGAPQASCSLGTVVPEGRADGPQALCLYFIFCNTRTLQHRRHHSPGKGTEALGVEAFQQGDRSRGRGWRGFLPAQRLILAVPPQPQAGPPL